MKQSETTMILQQFLIDQFTSWSPPPPEVVSRTTGSITLAWSLDKFTFLQDKLLFRVEKNNKLPKWIVVYSGGKTTKTIYDLAPSHPHKFRLKVILRNDVIIDLANKAIQHFGDENKVYKEFSTIGDGGTEVNETSVINGKELTKISGKCDVSNKIETAESDEDTCRVSNHIVGDDTSCTSNEYRETASEDHVSVTDKPKWVESLWSNETWTSTEAEGTSAVCFCMAVKCGYIKQIQSMLEERPELINIHSNIGFTPLATAVRKGDINIVRLLVSLDADVDLVSAAGQTPLHLAVLAAQVEVVDVLLEAGADVKVRDWNGLSVEHYAVDSCSVDMMRLVLDRGGNVHAKDNNGWTPLFRALCEGAKTDMIAELVSRGSDLELVDNAGLPLAAVARILKNRQGMPRESVLRLVESTYPHEKARAVFTRLSRKIHNLNQLLNLI